MKTKHLILPLVLVAVLELSCITFLLPTPVWAQPPRPTLPPERTDENDDESKPETSRITGTIIDLTTNTPAPGVTVQVGEVLVISDEHGNYDRSALSAGVYAVALQLAGQGTPAQGTQFVKLKTDETQIIHLGFYHPAPRAQDQ
jgi:hypothetical protein